MLVLSRGRHDAIIINDYAIRIKVLWVEGKKVRMAFCAPPNIEVRRMETYLEAHNQRPDTNVNLLPQEPTSQFTRLVLTRTEGQEVVIGGCIIITVARIDQGKARIGLTCHRSIRILREELVPPSSTPKGEEDLPPSRTARSRGGGNEQHPPGL